MTGGNTFFLWDAMRRSGLDELIKERVAAGVLYVGCSAGSIVAGRSIQTAFWKGWDDPGVAPDTDWTDSSSLQVDARAPPSKAHALRAPDTGCSRSAIHPPCLRAQGMGIAGASFFPHHEPSWDALVEGKRREVDHEVRTRAVGAHRESVVTIARPLGALGALQIDAVPLLPLRGAQVVCLDDESYFVTGDAAAAAAASPLRGG